MVPCREPRTVTAEATAATADSARAWLVMVCPLRVNAVLVTAKMVPDTVPFVPLLLTNTEKPALLLRFATAASRVISLRMSENSEFRVTRLESVVPPDADCAASVPSLSIRWEMLLIAPSLICRVDRPSLAFRIPWLVIAMSDR